VTKEEYEVYADLFENEGWKLFQTTVADAEEQMTKAAVDSAPMNDQWQFLRGQLTQLRSIAAFETFIKLTFEQAEEGEDE